MMNIVYFLMIMFGIGVRKTRLILTRFCTVYLSMVYNLTWDGFRTDMTNNLLYGLGAFLVIEFVSYNISREIAKREEQQDGN